MILRDETGGEGAHRLWNATIPILASWLVHTEAVVSLEAAARRGRLAAGSLVRARGELERRWSSIDAVAVTPGLAREAGALAGRHRLRALDAVHLATALAADGEPIVMATWDHELRRASLEAGLDVVP